MPFELIVLSLSIYKVMFYKIYIKFLFIDFSSTEVWMDNEAGLATMIMLG